MILIPRAVETPWLDTTSSGSVAASAYPTVTTRSGSRRTASIASGALNRADTTSSARDGGRHSPNFKFLIASLLGMGVISSRIRDTIKDSTSANLKVEGNRMHRLSAFVVETPK